MVVYFIHWEEGLSGKLFERVMSLIEIIILWPTFLPFQLYWDNSAVMICIIIKIPLSKNVRDK
jgi:hypothetical protein